MPHYTWKHLILLWRPPGRFLNYPSSDCKRPASSETRDASLRGGQHWASLHGGQHWVSLHGGQHWASLHGGQHWVSLHGGQHWASLHGGQHWPAPSSENPPRHLFRRRFSQKRPSSFTLLSLHYPLSTISCTSPPWADWWSVRRKNLPPLCHHVIQLCICMEYDPRRRRKKSHSLITFFRARSFFTHSFHPLFSPTHSFHTRLEQHAKNRLLIRQTKKIRGPLTIFTWHSPEIFFFALAICPSRHTDKFQAVRSAKFFKWGETFRAQTLCHCARAFVRHFSHWLPCVSVCVWVCVSVFFALLCPSVAGIRTLHRTVSFQLHFFTLE